MIKLKIENGYVGENVGFERIRRITGYLVGTLDRFNNAKLAEVEDRVKHGVDYFESLEEAAE
jgi:anaerobic ribonucleoside-triphosphate reductase